MHGQRFTGRFRQGDNWSSRRGVIFEVDRQAYVSAARLCLRSAVASSNYSGSGLPLVSGANGRAIRPIRKTEHMATPAYLIPMPAS